MNCVYFQVYSFQIMFLEFSLIYRTGTRRSYSASSVTALCLVFFCVHRVKRYEKRVPYRRFLILAWKMVAVRRYVFVQITVFLTTPTVAASITRHFLVLFSNGCFERLRTNFQLFSRKIVALTILYNLTKKKFENSHFLLRNIILKNMQILKITHFC